ncbi:MAG: PQQ-binding-like beta-propeller repeat protein [Nannocystaceae bacterium]
MTAGWSRVWRHALLTGMAGIAGCHPEAGSVPKECRSDADCGPGLACRSGRCKGAAPARAIDSPTASPQVVEAAGPRPRRGEGPIDAPAERWSLDLGAVISAAPTLVTQGDRVLAYVGSHAGRFVGVVAEGPGEGAPVLDLVVDGIIWSTAVADERGWLYFGADDDRLYAVDPDGAKIAWSRRLGACEPPRAPGPEGVRCDVDGVALGPSGDLFVGADGLYRIGRDGETRWHYPAEPDVRAAHVATTPLVTEDLVVYGTYARRVVALDHEGTLRWELELSADVDGSPVRGADGTIYVGADDGSMHALGPDGAAKWSYDVGAEVRGRAVVAPDGAVVFGSHDGNLYALEPSGQLRWVMPTAGPIHAAVAIDTAGRIFVGSRDEHLYAIDLDGHVYWNLELPDQVDSGVAIAAGGTLVLGCDDGVLRGLR